MLNKYWNDKIFMTGLKTVIASLKNDNKEVIAIGVTKATPNPSNKTLDSENYYFTKLIISFDYFIQNINKCKNIHNHNNKCIFLHKKEG